MRRTLRKMALLLTLCCLVAVWGIQLPKVYAVSPEEIREIQTNTVVADCLEKNDTVKYFSYCVQDAGCPSAFGLGVHPCGRGLPRHRSHPHQHRHHLRRCWSQLDWRTHRPY